MLAEHAIDARPANSEPAGDRRRPKPFLAAQTKHLERVDRWLAALVDAARLRGGDAFQLPLTAQIRFKLGKHAKHVEEGFARGGAGIDRLFGCLQGDASGL